MPPNLQFGRDPTAETPQPSPPTEKASSAGGMTPETSSVSDKEDTARGFENLNNTFELRELGQPSDLDGADEPYRDMVDTLDRDSVHEKGRKRKDSFMLYTPDEEKKVLRKLDRRLVLFMALLYLLSFLDRSNIGNAKIAGLSDELQLSSSQYEWLLTAFYITYIAFEWMTLLYRVVPAHLYISICVAAWGLIASLQCVTGSFASMLILRGLLGVAEAAFGPGVPFYLSFFFKREELALRTGLFISAAPLATSFASSLAWVITKAGEGGPISAWRLLFLIEGFPSIIVAAFAFYHIPDGPATAKFLTKRQKKVARLRLTRERGPKHTSEHSAKLDFRDILQTLIDPKCYITATMFFSCNVAFSSLPPFLPTIVNEMGYSALQSQALSAPPYLVSFVTVLLIAYLSDKYKSRSIFVCFAALLGGSGYLLIAVAGWLRANAAWRYAGVYPAAAGFFSAVTLIITWTINNQDSDSKKGTGVAMLNVIGQLGPLLGTRLYPDSDKPYYVRGMSVCAGFMFLVFILAVVLRFILARENAKSLKAYDLITSTRSQEEEGLVDGEAFTDESARFIYMI